MENSILNDEKSINSFIKKIEDNDEFDSNNSVKEIEKLSDYIIFIENLSSEFCLSRGQSNNHKLLPSAYRLDNKGNKRYEPKSIHTFLEEFKNRATHYFKDSYKLENEIEWIAHAQHFGIPTKLLDFSYSPMISLFFAVEKSFDRKDDSDSAIWFLNPYKLNEKVTENKKIFNIPSSELPSGIDDPVVIKTRSINNRINSQQGVFVYFNGNPTPLEEFIDDNNILKKVIIKAEYKKDILVSLHDIGFKFSDLYPELEYASKDIIMSYNINEYKKESNNE